MAFLDAAQLDALNKMETNLKAIALDIKNSLLELQMLRLGKSIELGEDLATIIEDSTPDAVSV